MPVRQTATLKRFTANGIPGITVGEEYDADEDEAYVDPETINLVQRVSTKQPFHVSVRAP